jgi:UDP-glucose 4-epimerase
MTKRIVVTGGAGFIGSHLVDRLIDEGHTLCVVDDLSGGYMENLKNSVQFHKVDIRNYKKLLDIFSEFKPQVVYHLAANAAESKAQFSPIDITSRNYDGAVKVLTAAITNGLERFIFTSSIAVYGAGQTPFKESSIPIPEDVYGVTKYAFEQTLKILSEVHNFEYVVVRPHNVYGLRQNMRDPYRNVVTIFMNALLAKLPVYIYGKGNQERCFSYIDDVATALVNCLKKSVAGMTFNIGSDKPHTVSELLATIEKVSGTTTEVQYLPLRPTEVLRAVSDHSVSKKYLQYEDSVDLITGLQRTWHWVQKQGYQKPKFTSIEIQSELLPTNWKR